MRNLIFAIIITIFTQNAKAQLTTILTFSGTTNGCYPESSLYYDGTFLYGTTVIGGAYNNGTIYKVKPDGTGYTKLLDFSSITNGREPRGSLISDGTFLYGTTFYGGVNDSGVIYKIMPDGTNYIKLLDFAGSTNGKGPNGSLYYDGTFLYGMTALGGINNGAVNGGGGVIFRIKPDGTGYIKFLDLNFSTTGSNPGGSFCSDGIYLYGLIPNGGAYGAGTLIKIKPDGSSYAKVYDFGSQYGELPTGSLIYDGAFFYGMTSAGGLNYDGVIFKIKPDGTGYTKLLDFAGATNGNQPYGALYSDGTFLYGMTTYGGINNLGTMFKIMPNGTNYTKLVDFAGAANGSQGFSSLISDGVFLYGTTSSGGAIDSGIVFKYQNTLSDVERIKNSSEQINIYPNPNNGNFVVEISNTNKQTLQIFDVNGEMVLMQNIQGKTTIDANSLNEGVYNISIINSEGIINKKLVITR